VRTRRTRRHVDRDRARRAALTLPPLSATLEPPAVADAVPLPHVVEAFGVLSDRHVCGKVSVNATPVSATALADVFATVIVKTDVPPTRSAWAEGLAERHVRRVDHERSRRRGSVRRA